jgi:predicted DNA-binding transcriptional regulator AlpA
MKYPSAEPASAPPPTDQYARLLSPSEAAEWLGVSKSWLAKLRLYGGGPRYVKFGRTSVRYRMADLFEWSVERLRASTSAADV